MLPSILISIIFVYSLLMCSLSDTYKLFGRREMNGIQMNEKNNIITLFHFSCLGVLIEKNGKFIPLFGNLSWRR